MSFQAITVRSSEIERNYDINVGSAIQPMQPTYDPNWLCPPTTGKCDEEYKRDVKVTDRSILSYPPLYRGIVLLASMVAKLPLNLVCGNEETGTDCEIQKDHPAHWLMRHQPNPIINSHDFKQTLQYHKCLGNSYAHIGRSMGGALGDLTILDPNPNTTFPIWGNVDGTVDLYYKTLVGDCEFIFHHTDILHFKGLSYDGIIGHRMSDLFKNELGLGIVTTEHKLEFYKDGGVGGGVLYFKRGLNPAKQQETMRYWKEIKSGRRGGTRVAMLNSDDVKFEENEIAARQAETDSTRRFQITMASNMVGLPQHKIGGERITSSYSLEQENKALLNDGYDPHLCAIEAQCDQKLLTKEERLAGMHFNFDRTRIEQATVEEMVNAADKYINGGHGTSNEWRRQHNLPKDTSGFGDKLRVWSNVQIIGDDQPNTQDQPPTEPEQMTAIENHARSQVESVLKRLAKSATAAAKNQDKYEKYQNEFELKHIEPTVKQLDSTNQILKSSGLAEISNIAEQFFNELPGWDRAEEVAELAKNIAQQWPDQIIEKIASAKSEND